MFENVHHIAIICSDYQQSKYFYSKILGFDIISEVFREERNSYKLNLKVSENFQIELFSFLNPPKRQSYPEACGLRHLAFSVKNIEQIVSELKQKGVLCENICEDILTGKKFTFFQDPDNLPIEIYQC